MEFSVHTGLCTNSMTSGDVIRHSLPTFCGPLCLLRPLELGFGLSALLRMFGHGCTYWGVPAGSEKENRDSVGHLRSAQAGEQGVPCTPLILPKRRLPTLRRLRLPRRALAERGLGGGEACDGNAERRARDVIERNLVAERDGGGVPARLAADPDLWLRLRIPTPLDAGPHQFAHAP